MVGDEHGGDAVLAQDGPEVGDERGSRRLVEAGERLVEQENLRLQHERASQRHPLRLAAGQGAGRPRGQRADAEAVQPPRHAALDHGSGTPRKPRPSATLAATVVSASSGSWNTVAMRRRSASASRASTGRPPTSTWPASGRSSRPSTRSSVDLPLPLGPITASTSPPTTSSAGTSG